VGSGFSGVLQADSEATAQTIPRRRLRRFNNSAGSRTDRLRAIAQANFIAATLKALDGAPVTARLRL
jgi:hypothetical protein